MTTLDTINAAIVWLFDTTVAIGSIYHVSYVWLDAVLVLIGMLIARPAGVAGRRMYASFRTGVKGLKR
jgi:hypothetical protein